MRISNAVLSLALSSLTLLAVPARSQSTNAAPKAPAAPAAVPPAAAPAASAPPASGPGAALQGALTAVQQTIAAVNVEKWKKGTIREEAGDHIGVIQRDLKDTMPPLIAAADAAPDSPSALLPLSRNIDAIYDVLLSVVEAAQVAGNPAQVNQLDQALRGLNTARVAFDEHLQQSADANEKQIADLQATVKAQAAVKCPVAPPPPPPACEPPAPAKKPVHKKPKPPATTATPPATTP